MKAGIQRHGVTVLSIAASALASWAMYSSAARADDLKLKDGTKISGTIVGFEENSFKVKTSYGFALVQKDQVVSISMADAPKPEADKPASSGSNTPVPAGAKASAISTSASSTAPASKVAQPVASQPAGANKIAAPSAAVTAAPSAAKNPPPAVASGPSAAPASAANVAPPKPPAAEPIREQVTGNTYTNETYRFRMFKPPDWDVIASAPAVMPGAITAMGTPDDTTYFVIGQEPAGKSLATDMDATEHRLRDVMENFRSLDEERIMVSGAVAIEHHFRGNVDQHDWSGVVVLLSRGSKLYTIFGMTRADNDLVQLQENVISRAISSLQFTE